MTYLIALVFFQAIEAEASDLSAKVQFSATPSICVLADAEDQCDDVIELSWFSSQSVSLCLFQTGLEKPLACWADASEGCHSVAVETGENLEFQLRDVTTQFLLLTTAYEVIKDRPEFYRRRRRPWSFF